MDSFLEILKYVLPALVVLAATYVVIRYLLEHDQKTRQLEMRQQQQTVVIPIRLQAYERVVLFLERISPANIVLRVNQAGMDARGLQRALLVTIREEYEHNLSQQVYLTPKAWEMVRSSKEEMTRLVNSTAAEVPEEASGTELAQRILENYLKIEKPMVSATLEFIKREISQLF